MKDTNETNHHSNDDDEPTGQVVEDAAQQNLFAIELHDAQDIENLSDNAFPDNNDNNTENDQQTEKDGDAPIESSVAIPPSKNAKRLLAKLKKIMPTGGALPDLGGGSDDDEETQKPGF